MRLDVSTTSGRRLGPDRAQFGDRHGVVGEHLEQERLELVVGAVDLVDEQHRRALLERLQDRPGDEEAPVVQRGLERGGVGSVAGRAQVQDLPREVPVVERLAGVDALVALQPHEPRPGDLGQRLRERGLADPRVTLQEQRPAHPDREVRGRRHPDVGQVSDPVEGVGHCLRVVE